MLKKAWKFAINLNNLADWLLFLLGAKRIFDSATDKKDWSRQDSALGKAGQWGARSSENDGHVFSLLPVSAVYSSFRVAPRW